MQPSNRPTPAPGETPTAPAELGSRLLALVVDSLAVAMLAVPIALVATALGGHAPGPVESTLLWFVYRAATDATGGSLGKRLLSLRVAAGDGGGRPGLGAGATRNLWGLSGLLPALLPSVAGNALAVAISVSVAATIARDPLERGWHDRLAGTVVRRPR